jgi:hypothetical protein
MSTADLNFGALTLCRVGDTLEVAAEHAQVGTWAYAARILWIRAGHVGLTPPDGPWQRLIGKDDPLALCIRQPRVTANLPVRAVGVTGDLPPVLVVRQEAAATPVWQDGGLAVVQPAIGTPAPRTLP